jgi:hypothetical protein
LTFSAKRLNRKLSAREGTRRGYPAIPGFRLRLDQGEVPKGAVGGSFDTGVSFVKADEVWCKRAADDSHVIMHIRFKNTGVEDKSFGYVTQYSVKNGGTHGDSAVTNFETTDVPAGQTVIAVDNAGTPSGVTPGSPLSSCDPN